GPVAQDEPADDRARVHAGARGRGTRVAAGAVDAVFAPAGRLPRREQALECRALPGRIGPDAAHGVVLRGPHRDPLLGRIDAEEVMTDLVDLAQVVLDVVLTQKRDVEPEVHA